MPDNPNQPREYDAVLGGQALPPVDGLVLGGIEGVIPFHEINDINNFSSAPQF